MKGNGKLRSGPKTRRIKLYVAEEQEILCQAYKSTFLSEPSIDVVGIVGGRDSEAIISDLLKLTPDVVLLGTKMLQSDIIEKLQAISRHYPEMGVVLLSALYDVKSLDQLRAFPLRSSKGYAFILKHSIDRTDQLVDVVHAVTKGLVVIDPLVQDGLFSVRGSRVTTFDDTADWQDAGSRTADASTSSLQTLTRRELEVLRWMARGLKNNTIAEVLRVDPRTVKCHVNSIYGKLHGKLDSKHPRIRAIMLYLKAIGRIPSDESSREGSMIFYDVSGTEHRHLCLS